jgi:hypothetical protein
VHHDLLYLVLCRIHILAFAPTLDSFTCPLTYDADGGNRFASVPVDSLNLPSLTTASRSHFWIAWRLEVPQEAEPAVRWCRGSYVPTMCSSTYWLFPSAFRCTHHAVCFPHTEAHTYRHTPPDAPPYIRLLIGSPCHGHNKQDEGSPQDEGLWLLLRG